MVIKKIKYPKLEIIYYVDDINFKLKNHGVLLDQIIFYILYL